MNSTAVKPILIATNGILGREYGCCYCDTFNAHGEREIHVPHKTLYYCQNPKCNHLSCKDHLCPSHFKRPIL